MTNPFLTFAAVVLLAPAVSSVPHTGLLQAQTPVQDSAPLAFEVASVKRNTSGDQRVQIGGPPGRFTASNAPLRLLIRFAYQIQDFQIEGGEGWLNSDRFDIVAKVEGEVRPMPLGELGPLQKMLQTLLADRFNLTLHREMREMPVYALVLARGDGRLGDKIRPATVDCAALMAGRRGGGPPPGPPPAGATPPCGMMMGLGNLNAGSMPIAQLARTLSTLTNRVVIDRTGLTGTYDFQLEYAPEQRGFPGAPGPLGGSDSAAAAVSERPSLFTALQEQLGLKLESERGPVEVFVIDSVEQPTED